MIKIFSILILFIITLNSCKKKEIETWYISDCAKSYIAFKPGTYWIFEDDSTHLIDSISVYELSDGLDAHYNQNNELDFYTQSIFSNLLINDTQNYANYFSAGEKFSFGFHIYTWVVGGCYCGNGSFYVKDTSNTIVNFATLSINNLIFSDVNELIQNNYNQNIIFNCVDLFLVRNIGIIKWKVNFRDGSTQQKSLIRYHIEI